MQSRRSHRKPWALSGDDRRLNRATELGDNVPVAPWSQYVRTAGDHTAKLTHVWALLHGSRQYGTSAISCCCERGKEELPGRTKCQRQSKRIGWYLVIELSALTCTVSVMKPS